MYLSTPAQQISAAVTAAVAGAALWRGETPERIGGATLAAAWLLSPLVEDRRWGGAQSGILAVDAAVLAILTALALRTGRRWPLWAAGFQLVTVVIGLVMAADRDLLTYTYLTGMVIWSYLVLIALAVGVWSVARRRRAAAPDPGG